MNKIRIKSTPLFKQVAAVIGEERAQIELAMVVHDSFCRDDLDQDFITSLYYAFSWSESPQGYNFWRSIFEGINPCKN